MPSSSTNKQPLLIDRPINRIIRLDNTSMPANVVDPGTATNGALLLDCTANDGALLETIQLIQRAPNDTTEIRLFLSTSSLALGTGLGGAVADSQYLASLAFGPDQPVGAIVEFLLPKVLFPIPMAGASTDSVPLQYRALRIEKGRALWAAANNTTPSFSVPQIQIQGGFH
jgi:hypothetical protein